MSDLKQMYKTIQSDPFPEEMRLILGDQELVFGKRTWTIENEHKGLRYGENPDQPKEAKKLLAEGLKELGIDKFGFSLLSSSFPSLPYL